MGSVIKVCDMCGEEVPKKDLVGLDVCKMEVDGTMGSYIYYAEICKNCAKKLLRSFKKKVDISTDKDCKGYRQKVK